MIYFLGSEPHYRAHLRPVIDELRDRGVETQGFTHVIDVPDNDAPLVSASCPESRHVARDRRIGLLEHGVGQTYAHVDHCGYAGGKDREHISLFLCPNPRTALLNQARYPESQVEVVGCPKLDRWFQPGVTPTPTNERRDPLTVAVSWHWDCNITHETRSAWPYFREALPRMKDNYRLLGHAHPRAMDDIRPYYDRAGIEVVEDFDQTIIEEADVLCVDNSSIGFEWMAVTDKPLVWLNSPLYRREMNHGVRFWEWATAATQVEHRSHWVSAVIQAQVEMEEHADRRALCIANTYSVRDGHSAVYAADAVEEWAA